MKTSKMLVLVLVVAVVVLSVGEYSIYGKLKKMKDVVTQMNLTIEQQGALVKKMTDQVIQKQKELDAVKSELDALKKAPAPAPVVPTK